MATTKRGRPYKPATPGQRSSLGLRVTAEIKDLLDSAAMKNGRTQSAEAEARLELTFRAERQLDQALETIFGQRTAGLAMLLAHVMRAAGQMAHPIATRSLEVAPDWMVNPFAYDQAMRAATRVLEAFRPEGNPMPDHLKEPQVVFDIDLNAVSRDLGRGVADPYLVAVADPNEASRADLKRIGSETREKLGDAVADRIAANFGSE
jgi:hypothetical protein